MRNNTDVSPQVYLEIARSRGSAKQNKCTYPHRYWDESRKPEQHHHRQDLGKPDSSHKYGSHLHLHLQTYADILAACHQQGLCSRVLCVAYPNFSIQFSPAEVSVEDDQQLSIVYSLRWCISEFYFETMSLKMTSILRPETRVLESTKGTMRKSLTCLN